MQAGQITWRAFYGTFTGLMLLGLLITACVPTRWESPARQGKASDIEQTQRSSRGNPPFYEVFGNRYYVLDSSKGHAERGVASWYGKKFHGKPTSSGEIYDMHAMTAAHKTLPLPTMVRVTNLRNGKRVVVRVNDRGPFVDNRIIDLSFAAAKALEMIGTGTTMVEIAALTDAGKFSAESRPVAASDTVAEQVSGRLYLQVGAFAENENAQRLRQQLQTSGITKVVIRDEQNGSLSVYRVRIGPLYDIAEYDSVVRRVATLPIEDPHLVIEPVDRANSPAETGG